MIEAVYDNIKKAIFAGNIPEIPTLVRQALSDKASPEDILNKGLIAGMAVVGEKFKANEIYVPEVLISAKAMHAGLDVLKPFLEKAGVASKGNIVIGTVKGDLHDIGKNLVSMMFKGAGFSVTDLGIDVPPEKFIDEAVRSKAQVMAMSSLLTTSMPSMKATMDLLKKRGLVGKIKTIIGGAPVTQKYADEIQADGYADNASSAVDKAKELLGL
ncbi:MAG: corrinoid protein [Candidatus Omnitrophica bacterium]|nr:corrinoid protein [Candidatus Omnitrophota bacterium]